MAGVHIFIFIAEACNLRPLRQRWNTGLRLQKLATLNSVRILRDLFSFISSFLSLALTVGVMELQHSVFSTTLKLLWTISLSDIQRAMLNTPEHTENHTLHIETQGWDMALWAKEHNLMAYTLTVSTVFIWISVNIHVNKSWVLGIIWFFIHNDRYHHF